MQQLPAFVGIFFVLTTFMTVLFFYRAAHYSKPVLLLLLSWLAFQAAVSLTGFYTITDTLPPRFLLLAAPALVVILLLFVTPKGRAFLDTLDLPILTLLHVVRIPVELVLFWLFINGAVPEAMTFEGRNFDILSGLTAPVVFYFFFTKKIIGKGFLLGWNMLCLLLLLNIVVNAVFAAPSNFQQIAFEQPNVAVLHFPFAWLPCCVVPLVLLSHLAAIRKLVKSSS